MKPNTEHKDKPLTSEQSQNLDLAEKGIQSPLNPTQKGEKADSKDEETVVKSATKEAKRHPAA